MNQSKKHSIIETVVQVGVGFATSILLSYPIYKLCGVKMGHAQVWTVTGLFTITSLIRSYYLRRFFNKLTLKIMQNVSKEDKLHIRTPVLTSELEKDVN